MHRHWCDVAGHDYECSKDCLCICGLPMNGNDHSECPVELRACPQHEAENEAPNPEAVSGDGAAIETTLDKRRREITHCQCGCANADRSEVVGWCLWCDHVYTEYTPAIQDEHFAHHCPGAPSQLKETALASLAKRRARK